MVELVLEDARTPVGQRQRQRLSRQVLRADLDPVRALLARTENLTPTGLPPRMGSAWRKQTP